MQNRIPVSPSFSSDKPLPAAYWLSRLQFRHKSLEPKVLLLTFTCWWVFIALSVSSLLICLAVGMAAKGHKPIHVIWIQRALMVSTGFFAGMLDAAISGLDAWECNLTVEANIVAIAVMVFISLYLESGKKPPVDG